MKKKIKNEKKKKKTHLLSLLSDQSKRNNISDGALFKAQMMTVTQFFLFVCLFVFFFCLFPSLHFLAPIVQDCLHPEVGSLVF